MKQNEQAKQMIVSPIGEVIIKDKGIYLVILPEYIPALKYLELFSHIQIIFQSHEENMLADMPERFIKDDIELMTIRNQWTKNKITVVVSRIIQMNEDEGIIEIDHIYADHGAAIYDIKAYFPVEDRVENFVLPDSLRKWAAWRPETTTSTVEKNLDRTKLPIEVNLDTYEVLNPVGVIKKREGDYYLELNQLEYMMMKKIYGFSHVKILWWFDRFDNKRYRKITQGNPPYENAPRTGVYASRSPVRPNPIAMTTARIIHVDEQRKEIKVTGLDAFDNTTIIDILPYIPFFDRVKDFFVPNWLEHWPQWLEEKDTTSRLEDIELKNDIGKIKDFLVTTDQKVNHKKDFFSKGSYTINQTTEEIIIKGANQNNLKNITVSIPKNKITVITGVSGSGKSSLAFDTLYAESQQRFMDSLSSVGRMTFKQLEKPDVEQITGLPPAIAIEQKTTNQNPRSTVGTITDLYSYMRLLFSKIGTRYCPDCKRAIHPMTAGEIAETLLKLKPNTHFDIEAFNSKEAADHFKINFDMDNIKLRNALKKQIENSVQQGLDIGKGAIIVTINDSEKFLSQSKEMCYHCNKVFFDLTPSTFSFNNPEGMCPVCNGLGVQLEVDPELIVSNTEVSILDGASDFWGNLRKHRKKPNANWMKGEILALATELNVDLELPWNQLPEDFKEQALYGSNGKKVKFTYENSNGRKGEIIRPVEGAVNILSRLFKDNNTDSASRIALTFMREKECKACNGERLAPEGRMIVIANTRFPQTIGMTIMELRNWVVTLPDKLNEKQLEVAEPILYDLNKRLENLIDVGVHYLTLNRGVPTLSGGEAQRLRLATQLGCGLTNLLYILDEPSIGLHPKDHNLLLKTIKSLREAGNTVVIVEHDPDTMLIADKIIDIGPGAGEYGGKIIAEGTPDEIMNNSNSITGEYLKGSKGRRSKDKRDRKKANEWIKVFGAQHNNLKNIDVKFPLGIFTCITGVSGSGKSSLISKTLYPVLARYLGKSEESPGKISRIDGLDKIDKAINVTQRPIGRTPRSNPATYTGVFDAIRKLYASTEEAKMKGFKQNRFSFNSKEGRCESCGGEGRKRIQMHFMPDVWIKCSQCHGKRFNPETLEILYNGKSIADVLDMDVNEALAFFHDKTKIRKVLQTLYDVGLGYIKLGQSALSLSGGEAQRIKLAKELCQEDTGKTIYFLDEPTTGLHFSDIQNLLKIIHRITDAGNTVIVIEHNGDMMKNADWIIDLGPEGGDMGGSIAAQGTPEEVAENDESYTGRFIKNMLR